jgi:hypothetical protein
MSETVVGGAEAAQAPRSVCASFWGDGRCPYGDACTLLHVRNPKGRPAVSSPAHRLPSAIAVEVPQPPPLQSAAAAAARAPPPTSPVRLPAPGAQPPQQQSRQQYSSPGAGAAGAGTGAGDSSAQKSGRKRAPPKATSKTSRTRCMFFQKGRCQNTSEGGECPFLHEFEPPRPGRPVPSRAAFAVAAQYEARKAAALHPGDPVAAAAAAAQATERIMQMQEERTGQGQGQPRVRRAAPGHSAQGEEGDAKPGRGAASAGAGAAGAAGAGPRAGARAKSSGGPANGNGMSSKTLAGYHSKKPCRFFLTAEGCKNGDACGHSHDPNKIKAYAEQRREMRQAVQGAGAVASRAAA